VKLSQKAAEALKSHPVPTRTRRRAVGGLLRGYTDV
jgi:hypothetical protein